MSFALGRKRLMGQYALLVRCRQLRLILTNELSKRPLRRGVFWV